MALRAHKPQDMSRYLESGGTLDLKLRLDEKPSGEVQASVDCGSDCAGSLSLQESLQQIPVNEWTEMSIDLQCFAKQGADFSRVESSLLLENDKPLLAVVDTKYMPSSVESATLHRDG
ncbi:putative glycoside hydrolase [Microbulbifer thermotolerans]|uniref:putative glycoside hydrolase n=1 Tax=Microbulbifer thermotolerans TaxID=252514 RepID=UPI002248A984|nr:putative glycoside hydrolase [Microbulbifer thermotolerans]MCX2796407.1 putative glycoside hydrolase [Microbulbifer thermotolerans]